ncbi:TATA element modulatory factor-like isoform X2 [Corticium candelabrum]|uniref:TATA element modulatory factor-like isoform X2 n=1 Tax=Corticium candelabrum TaxID=121492 RepID=UPI002E356507|nr:TATA element modulatory factor-like isoform X2 [Corticium candelabrum]
MSWLGSTGLADFAFSALSKAQKRIDKVLDIREDKNEGSHDKSNSRKTSSSASKILKQNTRDEEKESSAQTSTSFPNSTESSPEKSFSRKQQQTEKPTAAATIQNEEEFSWNVLFDGESSSSLAEPADRPARQQLKSPSKSPSKSASQSSRTSRKSTSKHSEKTSDNQEIVSPEAAILSLSARKQADSHDDKVTENEKIDTNQGRQPLSAEEQVQTQHGDVKTHKASKLSTMSVTQQLDEKNKGQKSYESSTVETDGSALVDSHTGMNTAAVLVAQSLPADDISKAHSKEEGNLRADSSALLVQKGDVISHEDSTTLCMSQPEVTSNKSSHLTSKLKTEEEHQVDTTASVQDDKLKLEQSFELSLLPPSLLDCTIEQKTDFDKSVRDEQEQHEGANAFDTVVDELSVKTSNVGSELHLQEDVERLSELVKVRERQLLTATQETAALQATNGSLRHQLESMEESRAAENTDLDNMRKEFCDRISVTEKKLQTVSKDRDKLKQELQDREKQQQDRIDTDLAAVTAAVKEKDEQIAGLMEEGERLSKQQLQSSNTIKKLRASSKKDQQLIASLKAEVQELEANVKDLKETLKLKEENEDKYQDAVSKLNAACEHQNKELSDLKEELDATSTRCRGLEGNLDNTYREVAELRRSQAASQTAAQQAAVSAEVQAKGELKQILEQQKMSAQRQQDALAMQIEDMQHNMSRAEQQAGRREDNFRQEIADLQQRLQEAESRNEELSQSVSLATKPLLRQIENLQHTHRSQSAAWERVERNLTERLSETQSLLATATERERLAVEHVAEIQSRVQTLDTQTSSHRQEKSRLAAEVELLQARCDSLEESLAADRAKYTVLQSEHARVIEESKREKIVLEQQFEQERARAEVESQKAITAMKQRDAQLSRQQSLSSIVSSGPSSPMSLVPTIYLPSQDEILEHSLHVHSPHGSVSLKSRPEKSGGSRTTLQPVLEALQSQLKQREGEVHTLQSELISMEKARDALGEEVVSLSTRSNELALQVTKLSELRSQNQEVEQRYAALLQMYGEKAEEADELRLDLQDVKSMYRQQIEQLLKETTASQT